VSGAGAFLGRFHPLLVHFPIALLVLAGLVELIAGRRGDRSPWASAVLAPLAALAALAAVVAATAGYLLGATGGYGGSTFLLHRLLGITVALLAILTALVAWQRRQAGGAWTWVLRGLLALTIGVLTAAGHLGATLTHGDGYLTELAPAPIRNLLGAPAAERYTGPPERAPIYRTLVHPILQRHCASCHASGAPLGGLALDTPDAIQKGGDHGPVIVPEHALASELIRRVWLPPSHQDAMPPRGQRPLAPADAAVLRWWIDTGASFEATIADVEIAPDVLPGLEARLGPIARGGPTVPSITLPAVDPSLLAAARARGVDVSAIADGSPFLQARLDVSQPADAAVAALAPLAPHVLWLSLAGSRVSDAALPALGKLRNLTRLDLSRTATTDAGVQALAGLPQLETVNLYGTKVTDAGLAPLATMPRLRRVYVWQTAVTPAGVEKMKATAPKLEIVLGDDTETAPARP
jgi:uncharacterized membrane protein/mono/diheme cytochrome c family protein